MIRLYTENVAKCYFLNRRRLRGIVIFILRELGIVEAELSIIFTTDRSIKRLNLLYRKRNRPTDVLAFDMQEGICRKIDSSILGDIIISVETARRQARAFNSSFKKEICLYIIHGILHLAGYDDKMPSRKKKMRRKEEQLLSRIWKEKRI